MNIFVPNDFFPLFSRFFRFFPLFSRANLILLALLTTLIWTRTEVLFKHSLQLLCLLLISGQGRICKQLQLCMACIFVICISLSAEYLILIIRRFDQGFPILGFCPGLSQFLSSLFLTCLQHLSFMFFPQLLSYDEETS